MGGQGLAKTLGTHEEEVAELQRRFNALAEQRKASSENPALLFTKDLNLGSFSASRLRNSLAPQSKEETEAELKRLDAQIIDLRKRHDKLHDSNSRKRRQAEQLSNKLKALQLQKFTGDESPQTQLARAEEDLVAQAQRYDEAHRCRLTYEQIISRLKRERVNYPAELQTIEEKLAQKERERAREREIAATDGRPPARPSMHAPPCARRSASVRVRTQESEYEQLLLLSHDAHMSKQAAKQELSKFEAIIAEERRSREGELQQRRKVLQSKQQKVDELDKSEKARACAGGPNPRPMIYATEPPRPAEQERRAGRLEAPGKSGTESARASAETTLKLIELERHKIAAYEAAFSQIKDATGVADVNEVIQKFTTQEETHQSLLAMKSDAEGRIEELREANAREQAEVERLQHALGEAEQAKGQAAARGPNDSRDATEKERQRWKRLWRTQVNVKAAVQHLMDTLAPVKVDDENTAPLSDETLLDHLRQIETKLSIVAAAFLEESEHHAELLGPVEAVPPEAARRMTPSSGFRVAPSHDDEAEEDERSGPDDDEEDVPDRYQLKESALALVGRSTKRGKKKKATE